MEGSFSLEISLICSHIQSPHSSFLLLSPCQLVKYTSETWDAHRVAWEYSIDLPPSSHLKQPPSVGHRWWALPHWDCQNGQFVSSFALFTLADPSDPSDPWRDERFILAPSCYFIFFSVFVLVLFAWPIQTFDCSKNSLPSCHYVRLSGRRVRIIHLQRTFFAPFPLLLLLSWMYPVVSQLQSSLPFDFSETAYRLHLNSPSLLSIQTIAFHRSHKSSSKTLGTCPIPPLSCIPLDSPLTDSIAIASSVLVKKYSLHFAHYLAC